MILSDREIRANQIAAPFAGRREQFPSAWERYSVPTAKGGIIDMIEPIISFI
jgi:hypothetical protein